MVIETDADEANYGNNEKDVSVHAKCAISLSSGNGGTVRGTGSYISFARLKSFSGKDDCRFSEVTVLFFCADAHVTPPVHKK